MVQRSCIDESPVRHEQDEADGAINRADLWVICFGCAIPMPVPRKTSPRPYLPAWPALMSNKGVNDRDESVAYDHVYAKALMKCF